MNDGWIIRDMAYIFTWRTTTHYMIFQGAQFQLKQFWIYRSPFTSSPLSSKRVEVYLSFYDVHKRRGDYYKCAVQFQFDNTMRRSIYYYCYLPFCLHMSTSRCAYSVASFCNINIWTFASLLSSHLNAEMRQLSIIDRSK